MRCHSSEPAHFHLPQNPVPADQLTAERLGCGNPGGAPGSITAPAHAPAHVPHGPAAGDRPELTMPTTPWGELMAKTIEAEQQQEGSSQEAGA